MSDLLNLFASNKRRLELCTQQKHFLINDKKGCVCCKNIYNEYNILIMCQVKNDISALL